MPGQPPTEQAEGHLVTMGELGLTGLNRYGGAVREEFVAELKGKKAYKAYREMSDNDPVISAILFAIEQLVRGADWSVEAAEDDEANKRAAEFLEQCMHDMSHSWESLIAEIISFLRFGWSYFEICWKARQGRDVEQTMEDPNPATSKYNDGLIGIRKIPIRSQDTLHGWSFDDSGGIRGMTQVAPPRFTPTFIPISKALLFRTTESKGNPEGRSMLRGAYRCYSEDTEILTRSGWIGIGEAALTDEILTLNPDTEEMEYQQPTELHSYDVTDEELFHQIGRGIDLLVTKNHNMWVRRAHKDQFEMIEAADVPKRVRYRRNGGEWAGCDMHAYTLPARVEDGGKRIQPARKIPMDTWLKILGFYIAEGCAYRKKVGTMQSHVYFFQNEGPNAEWLRGVFREAGLNWTEQVRDGGNIRFTVSSIQLYEALAPLGTSHNKYIPEEIKNLPPHRLSVLWDALCRGDGSVCGNADGYEGTAIYYTASKRLADDVSEIILKMGDAPMIRLSSPNENKFGGPVWVVSRGRTRMKSEGTIVNSKHDDRSYERYTGSLFCVTVPNHIVYVRRNGKSCWCGNSWHFKTSIEEIEAIGIERDLAGLPVMHVPFEILTKASNSALKQELEDIIRNVRRDEQEGVLLPYDPENPEAYKFELLSTGGRRQFNTNEVILRYDARMAGVVLADFVMLGHEKVGSFSLATEKRHIFEKAVLGWLDSIAAVFNNHLVPRLFDINAASFSGVEEYPQIIYSMPHVPTLTEIVEVVAKLSDSGAEIFPDLVLTNFILAQAGLPEISEEGASGMTEFAAAQKMAQGHTTLIEKLPTR